MANACRARSGNQQVVSAARAMQHDKTPSKPGRRGSITWVQRPSSPIVAVSRQLPVDLIARLRQHSADASPGTQDEVLQLVKDARKVSDHDGVLSAKTFGAASKPTVDEAKTLERWSGLTEILRKKARQKKAGEESSHEPMLTEPDTGELLEQTTDEIEDEDSHGRKKVQRTE